MLLILKHELIKTYFKWRTYIGFIAIAVLVPVVQAAFKLEGGTIVKRMTRGLDQDFLLIGNFFNGYFVTQLIMNSLWVHIPFLISLVAGDQLAGEATGGTFRLLLIRPASRTRILFAKYITTLFYSYTLVAFLALVSLGMGLALFGSGPLIVPGKAFTIIPVGELMWRMCIAFGLAAFSMWCVASLAFLFSSLVENAIGPIIGTMTVIIIFLIISNIPVDLFKDLRPYFFTSYLNVWQKALEDPIPWQTIRNHLAIIGGHCIGFYLITWYIFVKKDILS
jgi:ABC-2 type transport system permease protein